VTIYLLDTNVISDLLAEPPEARQWARIQRANGNQLAICQPVYYEVLRGLVWRNATAKLGTFNSRVLPLLDWVSLTDKDWQQAAIYWASTRSNGKQLGDPDLLLAALATRLAATIVSRDKDFDALSIHRIDWRTI
jgi:predicted nucleic acid-binding protein